MTEDKDVALPLADKFVEQHIAFNKERNEWIVATFIHKSHYDFITLEHKSRMKFGQVSYRQ